MPVSSLSWRWSSLRWARSCSFCRVQILVDGRFFADCQPVGINERSFVLGKPDHLFKGGRQEPVIGIQEEKQLAFGFVNPVVSATRRLLPPKPIASLKKAGLTGVIFKLKSVLHRVSVINNNDFPMLEGLGQQAIQGFVKVLCVARPTGIITLTSGSCNC
jgi:hypothetical protein